MTDHIKILIRLLIFCLPRGSVSYTDQVTWCLLIPWCCCPPPPPPSSTLEVASVAGFHTPFQSYPAHVSVVGAYRLNLLLMCSSANTWYMFLLTLHWTCQEPSTELVLVLWILSCNVKGWPHLIHGWLHLGLRSTEVPLWRSPTWTKQPLWFRGKFTLKVAKASEAISNVDSSTYLKKSLNWLEKRMILASGSCRIHSLSIIPQRKAICGASYLKHKEDKAEELSH